jgi:hypothetical protein
MLSIRRPFAHAWIVTDPGASANTVPKLLVSLLMVATELLDELRVGEAFDSCTDEEWR